VHADWIVPDWPAPPAVRALQTTRQGGTSSGPYRSLNLGDHVGDDPAAVAANRDRLRMVLPATPIWLQQVHGIGVVDADSAAPGTVADASIARRSGSVCGVMTADCLPILLCDREGTAVAAIHAGWRGLAAGVIEAAVRAMGRPGSACLAWLGPAIGPDRFEVGAEVREAFTAADPAAEAAFSPGAPGKWFANLDLLARQRLARVGIDAVFGGGLCTASDPERFFSHRRDGVCGRQASFVWLVPASV